MEPLERRFLASWRRETLSNLPSNGKILEIGAGTGLNFSIYPQNQKNVTASEISIEMLQFAKTRSNEINLVQADAEELPFNEDSFDAAVATLVFCSIPKPEKAFAELQRVLKAKGRIVLLEHVRPNGLFGYLFDVINPLTVALFEDHFNRKTAEVAEKSGLRIAKIRKKAFGVVNLIVCDVVK